MEAEACAAIEPARYEDSPQRRIAGISAIYNAAGDIGISAQWHRFSTLNKNIPAQAGESLYGLITPPPEGSKGFQYLAGVEVEAEAPMPEGIVVATIEAGRFAVFEHCGHVSALPKTCEAIMRQWQPVAANAVADGTLFFERYGNEFDPQTGLGVVEIWVPLQSSYMETGGN